MTVRQYTMNPDYLALFAAAADHPSMSSRRDVLLDVIDSLPVLHREVVERLYWERISQRVLADELGMSRRTLTTRRDEALELIRIRLACNVVAAGFARWVAGQ